MTKVLVGTRNIKEIRSSYQKLTNDKSYDFKNFDTGIKVLTAYLKTTPNILILDNSLQDIHFEDIIQKITQNPIEEKNCNIILTLPSDYHISLCNVSKIHTILYKPLVKNKLVSTITQMSIDFNTPDLEFGEIDFLLQSLNFNCLSSRI